jgi:methylase of polypeptide subunit release factors
MLDISPAALQLALQNTQRTADVAINATHNATHNAAPTTQRTVKGMNP